jgi:signal transduction histidine kinase
MSRWRGSLVVVAVAAAGALGTFLAGLAMGMGSELAGIARALLPAAILTVIVGAVGGRVLARLSLRARFVGVAVLAAAVAIANVFVLSRVMFVSHHDAALVMVVVVFAVGAGIAAALAAARRSADALEVVDATAARLGSGELDARVGELDAGAELDRLGRSLDAMASRLQEARGIERRAEDMRRDLITAVSHDLRTPLSSLRAMVEAIDDGVVADPSTVRRYVGEMRRSIDQLVTMVDDLFELVRLEAGAIQAEQRRVALADVVGTAMSTVSASAQAKSVRLETDLVDVSGVTCSPHLVRVLQNLLTNAVRHTPADGTVRVEARRSDDSLELAVADSGTGIPPEDASKIFEPFYRGDPARSGNGSGLGLTLAERIVEGLGGKIATVDGGGGARFEIALPLS